MAAKIGIKVESVRSLLIRMGVQGQPMASGTGFVAHAPIGPVLVTNRHNVTGRHPETNQPLSPTGGIPDEVAIYHNQLDQLGSWVERRQPLLNNGTPLWIEHPALGSTMDVVALRLTALEDVHLYPYDTGPGQPDIRVGPAEPVSVVGFPFGLTGAGLTATWATGFVATEMEIDYNGRPTFLIDCRSRQGQSGSPVIAHRSGSYVSTGGAFSIGGEASKFLGVYSGRINAESDLGIVWKAAAVHQLIQSVA